MADQTSRRYLFVTINRATRWVFIRIYNSKTAANARRFLRDLERACPMQIRTILTDNGKEFTDRLFGLRKRAQSEKHEFDKLCAELDIEHRLTPPRSPQPLGECAIHLPVSEPTVWSSGSMVGSKKCFRAITSDLAKNWKPRCIVTSGSTPSSCRNQLWAASPPCKR